jgi:hypothetical protein
LIILVLFIVAVLAGIRVWQATRPRVAAGAVLVPGKAALIGKQAPVPHFRRKDAA